MIRHALVAAAVLTLAAPAAYAVSDHGDSGVDAMALYSQGSAVVQDSRNLNLKQGRQTVSWPVSGGLQPDTLWLWGDGVQLTGFSVPDQSAASGGLLAGRIGHHVTVTGANGKKQQGTLVATEGETAYIKIDDRIERLTPGCPARLGWPAENHQDTEPAINLQVIAHRAGRQKLTVAYQSDAPSWQTSYTGRFDPGSGRLKLTGAAIIDNSGHGRLDADQAWLVAGDISRADSGRPRPMMARMKASDGAAAGAAESVGDVYRYPLAHGLHLPAGVIRSVALMQPITVHAKRQYRFATLAASDAGGDSRRHARVRLLFNNNSKQPLPAGSVRIYNAAHTAQLMGGTRIDDTSAGAPVVLKLGEAFDITGTHHLIRQSNDAAEPAWATVEITLFNAGDSARQVTIAETLSHDVRLANDAPKPSGGSARRPEWQVKVPAHGRAVFRYDLQRNTSGS